MNLINFGRGRLELFEQPLQSQREDNLVSDSESDKGPKERSAKRRRIAQYARDYLQSRPIFIQSATLRGPFNSDWTNPWAKAKKSEPTRGRLKPKSIAAKGIYGSSSAKVSKACSGSPQKSSGQKKATGEDKTASSKKVVASVSRKPKKAPYRSVKANIANSKVRRRPNTASEESACRTVENTAVPNVPLGYPLPSNEQSRTAQSSDVCNLEHPKSHKPVTIGLTPINIRLNSASHNVIKSPQYVLERPKSPSRPMKEPDSLTEAYPSCPDTWARSVGEQKPGGNIEHQFPPEVADSNVPADRASCQSTHEATLRCAQSGTALRNKQQRPSRKGQRRSMPISNPEQARLGRKLKPLESASPFVFQRQADSNVDGDPLQAPVRNPNTSSLEQNHVLGSAQVLEVSFREDWALVEKFTNSILPAPPPDTTPSKNVTSRIRKILRDSGASIHSLDGSTSNEGADKPTTEAVTSRVIPPDAINYDFQALLQDNAINDVSFICHRHQHASSRARRATRISGHPHLPSKTP